MFEVTSNLRPIRSYVRRERRITPGQRYALDAYWADYGLDIEGGPLDLTSVFSRSAPCILEIGFGMGRSLLELAQENPDMDYLGVEVHRPGIGCLMGVLKAKHISNVRVFCADAHDVLKHRIVNESLDAVLLYFPDPWPKKRHHKRRLVQHTFVELVHSKLKVGGCLNIATDWQDYAEHVLETLHDVKGFINKAGSGNYSPRPVERPITKYERRGQRLGNQVWDMVFQKQ